MHNFSGIEFKKHILYLIRKIFGLSLKSLDPALLIPEKFYRKKSLLEELKKSLPVEIELLSSFLYQSVIKEEPLRFVDLKVRFSEKYLNDFHSWREKFEETHSIFIYYRIVSAQKRSLFDQLIPYANHDGIITQASIPDIEHYLRNIHGKPLPTRLENPPSERPFSMHRIDLTHEPSITIDGEYTTHFEDALYAGRLENGTEVLKIHFIDPTHYYDEKSEVIQKAYAAGLSLYSEKAYTIIDRSIIENELSLIKNQNRPVFTVEAKKLPGSKQWQVTVYQSVIKVSANIKIGAKKEVLDDHYRQIHLIRNFIAQIFSTKKHIAKTNEEPFARLFEEKKGIEFLADCMIFGKSQIAKFLHQYNAPVIWRNNQPYSDLDKEQLIARFEAKGIFVSEDVFDDATLSIKLFKQLQSANQRRLLADLIGYIIGRTVYGTKSHGFKPLGFNQYLEIKCRDASGLFNSYRLSEVLNPSGIVSIRSAKSLQIFADNMNEARKKYDETHYRLRFLEMLKRQLPRTDELVVGEVFKESEANISLFVDGFKYPLILEKADIELEEGSTIVGMLKGFDLKRRRFVVAV